MDWGSPLAALATALGIGLLIGAVRERQHGDVLAKAGVRTHALLALAGAVAACGGAMRTLTVSCWPLRSIVSSASSPTGVRPRRLQQA